MPVWWTADQWNRRVYFNLPTRYKLINQAGCGAYGVVCAAEDLNSELNEDGKHDEVAIKRIGSRITHSSRDILKLLRELKILKHFRDCPYVISVLNVFTSPPPQPQINGTMSDYYIVMELMATDLAEAIKQKQITPEITIWLVYQLLQGVHSLHEAGVMHRDLKPQNLLLSQSCDLKICDFGMAREDSDGAKSEYVVTRWYRAPELLMNWRTYGKQVDLFSVGCIMAEMLKGEPLFPGKDYFDQLRLVLDTMGTPTSQDVEGIGSDSAKQYLQRLAKKEPKNLKDVIPGTSDDAIDLLTKLLQFNPSKRISAKEALEHPYFDEYHSDEYTSQLDTFNDAFDEMPREAILAALKEDITTYEGCGSEDLTVGLEQQPTQANIIGGGPQTDSTGPPPPPPGGDAPLFSCKTMDSVVDTGALGGESPEDDEASPQISEAQQVEICRTMSVDNSTTAK